MSLYSVELKRQLKTKSVRILIVFSIILTFAFSYLPISYVEYTYQANGEEITVNGLEAISIRQQEWESYTGQMTPDKIALALNQYQEYESQYGEDGIFTGSMPRSEYYQKVAPIYRWITRLREIYTNPQTNTTANISELTEQDALNFYEQCYTRLNNVMETEQAAHPSAINQAKSLYSHVEMPFTYYPGVDGTVFDYLNMLIFVLVIVGALIIAPVFSNEYQTGSDHILRCTKYGTNKLAVAKTKAGLTIVISLYILCTVVFLLIENTAFGWESCKTSLQVPYSATSFLPINIGQTEIIVVAAGLLALFSTVCCILYLSSKMNTVYATTSVALLLCFIPMFISSILPQIMGMWVQCVLPTGGVGLLDSFFYELVDTNFLHIGSVSIWLPFMLLIFSIIEIPIWIIATIHSYTNHQI